MATTCTELSTKQFCLSYRPYDRGLLFRCIAKLRNLSFFPQISKLNNREEENSAPRVKRPEGGGEDKFVRSPATSTVVKNVWSHTSYPPHAFTL